jgi:hypothetical protein
MKLRILSIFFISAFATFFAAIAFAENTDLALPQKHSQKAQNRGETAGLFKNQYGRTIFLEQMAGIRKSDRLGTDLPQGIIAKDIARLLAPNENTDLALTVGVKAFPYRLNSYVAIACFAKNNSDQPCDKESYHHDRDDMIYLGLIEYDYVGSKLKLVANPLKIETNWDFLATEQFREKNIISINDPAKWRRWTPKNSTSLPNGIYQEFDLAKFEVNDTQTAFGLRVGRHQGYAGGIGYFEVLALFMIDNDRIINILAEPIYFFQNIAGDWNEDHTRQNYLVEHENVLVMLPSQTDGYYDLQIKAVDSDWEKTFSWDASLKHYLPKDRTAILNRVIAKILNL